MSKNKKLEDTLHSEIRRLEGKIDADKIRTP